MLADIRYALRGFRRSPGFALIAILSLTLGIGANTAIFSLVNAFLLRSLPVPEPNRLVLFNLKDSDGRAFNTISHWLYTGIRDRNTVLSGFTAMSIPSMTLSDAGTTERVQGSLVAGNFFQTLGVNALLGRVLLPEDDRTPGGHPVCVISYGMWQRRFGADPRILGRTLQLNGNAFTVLGVAAKDFRGVRAGIDIDIYVPVMMMQTFMTFPGLNNPEFVWMTAMGRLKPGVSVAQAQASLDTLYAQLEAERAPGGERSKVVLDPGSLGFSLRAKYERPLLLLMSVVGLVLLIACANVANLLMTRASGRRKEIAVRLALGAGRYRLIRQLLAESLILAASGAVFGIVLAVWVDNALLSLAPRIGSGKTLAVDVAPDWRVLVFTLCVSILVGVLFGLAPAIQTTRPQLAPTLKGESSLRGPGRFSFTKVMVVVQIGLSLVLLIGAGLFLRSLRNLKSIAPGFDPQHLVMMSMNPSLSGYKEAAHWDFFDSLIERAKATPGVASASLARMSPLSGGAAITSVEVPGYQPAPKEFPEVWMNGVGPDYFNTLGTPILAGRGFTEQDGRATKVAIVNERTAAHFWPHESPIGKRMKIGNTDCDIVGMVKDAKYQELRDAAPATAYVPLRQNNPGELTLHVRVAGNTAPVIAVLIREVRELDRNLPVYRVTTMEAQLDNSIALDRLMAMLTALFGFLAVALAAVGLYGVMAYVVAARTREIGIRMALGANRGRVLRHVMAESALLTAIGVGVGIPAALWASRAATSFLYGLKPTDPATYAALAAGLAVVALASAWIPAQRASRVDPMVSLRYE